MDEDGRRVTGKIMKDAARAVVGGSSLDTRRSSWMKPGYQRDVFEALTKAGTEFDALPHAP